MSGEIQAPTSDDTDEVQEVLDVRGAAKLLHMGTNAVYDACGSGRLPHRRIGNRIRFSRAALLQWLAGDDTVAG